MDTAHAPAPGLDPTTRRLILLLPVAFLAHDLGEVAGSDELNRALGDLAERFPAVADRLAPALAISRRQMAVAVGMLAAGLGVLAWQAARSAARSRAMTGYAAATLLFGGHIVGHVAHAVVLRRYLPGWSGAWWWGCHTRWWSWVACSATAWWTQGPWVVPLPPAPPWAFQRCWPFARSGGRWHSHLRAGSLKHGDLTEQ